MNQITTPLPLLEASKVKDVPVKFTFSGSPYVAWKTSEGYFAASASCPHRGADLSKGRVCGKALQCPYHGWTLGADGKVTSPAEQKSKGTVPVYRLTPRFGFLWLNGDDSYFAALEAQRGDFIGVVLFTFKAPLHVTVDNFCDGGHLPYVHRRNGANEALAPDTKFEWEEREDGIDIVFDYPQRPWTINSLFNYFLRTRWYVKASVDFHPIRVTYTIY